jgi:exonuclease SbcD
MKVLKILHTGDVHIGMKFKKYPDDVKDMLIKARFEALETLVHEANKELCGLFVISGDLFEKVTVPNRDVEKTIDILKGFAGDCVVIIPGNHDFDNGMVELWQMFKRECPDNIVVLNENKPYSLQEHDIDAVIYPAPCTSKHSRENNLAWMKNEKFDSNVTWHIGVAHGALEGLSPDMSQQYYYMEKRELENLPMDLWLLGHTHIPYPEQAKITGQRIFNAGTPEPDGMDCSHNGTAWIIEIDEEKQVQAKRLECGRYRFIDIGVFVDSIEAIERVRETYLANPENLLLRLNLKGLLDQDIYQERMSYLEELHQKLVYCKIDDSNLRVKITGDIIDKEFTSGSFIHNLLKELCQSKQETALQLAYEMIQEVRNG